MPKVHSGYLVKCAPSAAILCTPPGCPLCTYSCWFLGTGSGPSGLAVGTVTVGRRILEGGMERGRGGRGGRGSHSGLDYQHYTQLTAEPFSPALTSKRPNPAK